MIKSRLMNTYKVLLHRSRNLLAISGQRQQIQTSFLINNSNIKSDEQYGIFKSVYDDVSLPNLDICSLLFPRWEKWSDKIALESLDNGQKLTYGELLNCSLRWGNILKNMKLQTTPDEVTYWNKTCRIPPRVTIFAPNVIEYPAVLFGSLAAGFCLTTISSNYKVGEAIHALKDTKPEVLVVHSSLEKIAEEALRQLEMKIPVFTIGASSSGNPNIQDMIYQDQSDDKIIPVEMKSSDVSIILYSGGTTGLPKGVVQSHGSITSNLKMLTDPQIFLYGPETEYQHETVMGLMPFYHVYGLDLIIIINLYLGSKILVWESFDPNVFGKIIKEHKMAILHLVPTLLNFVINSPSVTTEDLETLRGILIASASVLPSSVQKLKEKINKDVKFQEGFGMTEVIGACLSPKNDARIGFCGQLIPNVQAKIMDLQTNKPLGPGQKGELVIKSPSMMSHYLNNPKATYEAIDEEGWLKTGDVAVATEDGYFSIVDRLKEIIKVKEFQVSPAEIENILMEHSAVAEAGVVGIPDDRVGERPRAYVSLKEKVSEQELIDFVKPKLASYKQLTGGVVILNDLPKSQAGKILRKDLKQLALEDSVKISK